MALNKTQLKTELKVGLITIFSNPQTNSNIVTVSDAIATLVSDKVDFYVKQGDVTGTTSGGETIVTSNII